MVSIKQEYIDFILKNPKRPLRETGIVIGGREMIGKNTHEGRYKNGYESKIILSKKKKKYMQINIITSRAGIVNYELKAMINLLTNKVKRLVGGDNNDLMNISKNPTEYVNNHLKILME